MPTNHFRMFENCRIYQHSDYWISNADGRLVLPTGLEVVYMTRGGVDHSGITTEGGVSFLEGITPSFLPFEHILALNETSLEIIAVKVLGPADGWEY